MKSTAADCIFFAILYVTFSPIPVILAEFSFSYMVRPPPLNVWIMSVNFNVLNAFNKNVRAKHHSQAPLLFFSEPVGASFGSREGEQEDGRGDPGPAL